MLLRPERASPFSTSVVHFVSDADHTRSPPLHSPRRRSCPALSPTRRRHSSPPLSLFESSVLPSRGRSVSDACQNVSLLVSLLFHRGSVSSPCRHLFSLTGALFSVLLATRSGILLCRLSRVIARLLAQPSSPSRNPGLVVILLGKQFRLSPFLHRLSLVSYLPLFRPTDGAERFLVNNRPGVSAPHVLKSSNIPTLA